MIHNDPDPVQDTVTLDGRRRRAEASRERIVAAMIELVREGHTTPPAEAVAERAGVGLRTVFRLFKDMDGLYRVMQDMMLRRLAPLAAAPITGETWREQLRALIQRRARLFEELMPMQLAGDAHRTRSPFLQKEHAQFVRLQRDIALALLPADVLADEMLVEMLDLAMSFDSWRRLRIDQGLPPDRAAATMSALVERVVGPE
jgi:AcrR family transcriptional regulator